MTRRIAAITLVFALLAVPAGALIGSQGWSLATTAIVGFAVTSGLTATAIVLAMLFDDPASRAHDTRV